MSIEAVGWALRVPVGGNAKVMLLGIANHAHPDGTESYPSLDTLAEYGHCDRSTARRNVRKLVADGWAFEDGHGPRGQTKYRLPLDRRGGKTPPVANEPAGGGKTDAEGVAPVQPEPSLGTVSEPSTGGTPAPAAVDQVPDDFPDELRPHARAAMRVLRDVAARKGGKAVTAHALGRVMMARPRKPLVKAAHDLAAWAEGRHQVRDVVATYRNWLDKETDLAAVELLPGVTPAAAPSNVTPLRRGGAEGARLERQQRRAAVARGDVVPSPSYPSEGSA